MRIRADPDPQHWLSPHIIAPSLPVSLEDNFVLPNMSLNERQASDESRTFTFWAIVLSAKWIS